MKYKKVISAICITTIGLCLYGCGSNSSNIYAKGNWEIAKTLEIKQKNNIGGFYNENYGLTVGYSGTIYYTNDGGENWNKSNNSSFCRFGLYIVNDKVAYNCGNGRHVRKTTDGGVNWKAVTDFGDSEPNHCRYLSFIDENTGWIGSPSKVAITKDGGNTWNDIKLPDGIGDILTIDLVNENSGYLIDSNENLYITKDGGQTWNSKKLNVNNMNNTVYYTNGSYLRFTDEKNGVLFYENKDNGAVKCAYTKDGGDTWKEKNMPEADVTNGYYLSSDGKILTITGDFGREMTVLKLK